MNKSLGQHLFEKENPFPLARKWSECHPKVQAEYENWANYIKEIVLKEVDAENKRKSTYWQWVPKMNIQ